MQAELKLTEEEIKKAITQYVQNEGWNANSVIINHHVGFSDPRPGESQAPYVTATVKVSNSRVR